MKRHTPTQAIISRMRAQPVPPHAWLAWIEGAPEWRARASTASEACAVLTYLVTIAAESRPDAFAALLTEVQEGSR